MKLLPKLFAPMFAIFIATGCSSSELDADPAFYEKEISDARMAFTSIKPDLEEAAFKKEIPAFHKEGFLYIKI